MTFFVTHLPWLLRNVKHTDDGMAVKIAEKVILKTRGTTEKSHAECLSMIMAEEQLKSISVHGDVKSH